MAINIGTQGIGGIYVGPQEIGKVYVGSQLVWEKASADTITIGTQVWMVNNLDINDGNGGVYTYDAAKFGCLYTYAAAVRIAATVPGYHLPSDAEWTTLNTYLGGLSVSGGKLKEAGSTRWNNFNAGTNLSGFTGVGGGLYTTSIINVLSTGRYWSSTVVNSTSAYAYVLTSTNLSTLRASQTKTWGLSVRLIKD